MKKAIYCLIALPFVVLVIYLAVIPSSTRKTFMTEFRHRTATLFGLEPEPKDGPKGLRIERPEEYGLQPAGEPDGGDEPVDQSSPEADSTVEAAESKQDDG